MNDVTVNDNNENGYEMKNIAGSRNQRTDISAYPIDTVRRRMMMTSGEAVKYKGSWDCAVKVIKSEGLTSLMRGAGKYHRYK